MTPERVVQANADLIGMRPAHLFSEFKRPVIPPFPCSTHCCGARLRCLRNCQACGVAGEAAGAQMHPALTTASCIHVSTTQANNRSIDELCIIPDSCTLQTRPSLGLDPPEIPPHLPTEPKTHARPRSRRRR